MGVWDSYWSKSEHSLYGKLCEIYRKRIMAHAVAYFFRKYFPKKGIFLEAGSGTSQTSVKIKKEDRKLIALDISSLALKKTMEIPQIDYRVKASIFQLPFKDSSLDGVWDLGVLE